jgi:hypothetical protein
MAFFQAADAALRLRQGFNGTGGQNKNCLFLNWTPIVFVFTSWMKLTEWKI